jgi:hypothetical protein
MQEKNIIKNKGNRRMSSRLTVDHMHENTFCNDSGATGNQFFQPPTKRGRISPETVKEDISCSSTGARENLF